MNTTKLLGLISVTASLGLLSGNVQAADAMPLTIESIAQFSKGTTKRAVSKAIGKPLERIRGDKDTWVYHARVNTSYGLDRCKVNIEFDNNNLLSRAYWEEDDCDNAYLKTVIPSTPNPADYDTKYNPANTGFDGLKLPRPPRRLAILDQVYPMPPIPDEVVKEQKPVSQFSMLSDVLFDFDSYELKPEAYAELTLKIEEALRIQPNLSIVISGHTDRIGTDAYNKQLSQKRAMAVGFYYVNQFKIDPNHVFINAIGSDEPVKECSDNLNREDLINCLAPNRRVVIVFLEKKTNAIAAPDDIAPSIQPVKSLSQ